MEAGRLLASESEHPAKRGVGTCGAVFCGNQGHPSYPTVATPDSQGLSKISMCFSLRPHVKVTRQLNTGVYSSGATSAWGYTLGVH